MLPPTSLLALWLATASSPVLAATAGSFVESGNTLVSAMMVYIFINSAEIFLKPVQMFLGNEEKVYILDKAEGNAAQVAGHPAWGAVW